MVGAWPGAASERVEALVTKPLEEAIRTVGEVATIEADSRPGFASINMELAESITAVSDVNRRIRDKVEQVPLPAGAQLTFDDERDPVALFLDHGHYLGGEGETPRALMTRLAETLASRLRQVRAANRCIFLAPLKKKFALPSTAPAPLTWA